MFKRLRREQELTAQIPRLRRYARALVGDRDRADDLVQDCLERGWSALGRFRGEDLRPWLFTILHNCYVSDLRRYRRQPQLLDMDSQGGLAALDAADGELALHELGRAIAALPDGQREVMLLVGLEQLSYAEVAEVLAVPIGTVMSRLSRAREQLRRQLGDQPRLRCVK